MNLSDPIFADANEARKFLEAERWPNGPVCPHCGNADQSAIRSLQGSKHRVGLFQCNAAACREQFTVTIGTVFERSKIPLNKWLLASFLMASSKKGMSAHQLFRMLGFGSYRTAWFMAHRIREAMDQSGGLLDVGALGGADKVVEADETYIGGKAKNRAKREPAKKKAVLTLIERDGRARSFHVANVTAETVRPIVVTNADRASAFMTDESVIYPKMGKEFGYHGTVNHSAEEYARMGGYIHVNTSENFFSILKRGITGTYHSVSEAHLHRYLAEFDFRYNNRSGLGVEDDARTRMVLRGAEGKRLMYRRPASA